MGEESVMLSKCVISSIDPFTVNTEEWLLVEHTRSNVVYSDETHGSSRL